MVANQRLILDNAGICLNMPEFTHRYYCNASNNICTVRMQFACEAVEVKTDDVARLLSPENKALF